MTFEFAISHSREPWILACFSCSWDVAEPGESCGKAVPVEPSECPVSMFDKEVYFMWGEGNYRATSERAKTSVYVGKGLPAASRLDRLMNFFTELFVSA